MKRLKKILKWFLGISLSLVLLLIVAIILYAKSEEKQLSGLNTKVVDVSKFNVYKGNLAITNANVLSTSGDSILQNKTILIKDNIIESIQENSNIPYGYKLVDAKGKFIIPGLIDTHIHPYRSKNDLLLFLANGVTHVAIMSSWRGLYLEWKEDAKQGSLSPQIYVAVGPMNTANDLRSKIYGALGPIPLFNSPDDTKEATLKYKNMGYDALKAYTLDKENYYAVAEGAKHNNIPMVGHLTPFVTLDDLYNSGQSQVAHVEELTKAVERQFGGRSKIYYDSTEIYLKYIEKEADLIAQKLKKKNIAVSTTIDVNFRAGEQALNTEDYLRSIELEYINPGILEGSVFSPGWLPGSNRYENPNRNNPEDRKYAEIYWKTNVEALHIMTRALARNGVTISAGTDSGNPGIVSGFSIHDELRALSDAGLSNAEVLRSATINGAEWLESNSGIIDIGKRADLVVLDKNPLISIENTESIEAVIANGKFLDRSTLDNILKTVKDANNESRKISIDEYKE